tara:strand:+ start:9868 stop:10269 length:402 start_codon:yes stop_codon:yes gene_type:complete
LSKYTKNSPTVIIDGDCVFCNYWGNYIILNDSSKSIFVTSSSSKIGIEFLEKTDINPEKTILFLLNNKYYSYSDAVIKIALKLGGWHNVFLLGYLIPKKIRNFLYEYIAKRRKKIMTNACHIQDLKNRDRFIS